MTSALRLLQSIVNRSRYTVVLLRSGATQQKHHIDNSSASSASSLLSARHFNSLGTVKRSILFEKPLVGGENVTQAATTTATRNHYTFNFPNNIVRYRRTTRPRKTTNTSTVLNYEQAQFVEKLGVTKSWNSWNTSNLYDSKREAESARDDILIRKFIFGTFHELISSEIIIKRRLNTINIGFLIKLPNVTFVHKTYFLCGYAEELLSSLLKCVVKIQPQSIYNKNDLIFRRW